MKTKLIALFIAIFSLSSFISAAEPVSAGLKTVAEETGISAMSITVTAESSNTSPIEIRSFAVGTQLFTNRTNMPLSSIPVGFEDFQFLAYGADNTKPKLSGTIKASENGFLYLAARNHHSVATPLAESGWTKTAHEFLYATTSPLVIYEKAVIAGESVEIPQIVDFRGVVPVAKNVTYMPVYTMDEMAITVEVTLEDANIFTKRIFDNGVELFSNRNYTISEAPETFKGAEFLANEGAKVDKGIIIPSADGTIYLIARTGGLDGWESVEVPSFYYSGTTEMSIYKKTVIANQRVEIPEVTLFQGATPIAKSITVKVVSGSEEARLKSIQVDGIELTGFTMEKSEYEVFLPYTYTDRPQVEFEAVSATATTTLAETETVTGTEDERTATITVTSEDGNNSKAYKVLFTVVPKMDLYLCIGQSNMAGYSPLDAGKGDLQPMDKVYLLNSSNNFEQARNSLNRYSNVVSSVREGVGPSYTFAQSIKSYTDAPVGLIVNARGGSSVENWTKGGTGDVRDTLYQPTMNRVLEAMKWGEFKGIIWHQGEANKGDLTDYMTRLQQLVSDLRTDLNAPNLPFIAGQIGTFGSNVEGFNNLIQTISEHITNADWVSAEGLGNIPNDYNHFDREASLELGKRYAKKMARKVFPPVEMAITMETDAGIFEKRTMASGVAILIDRPQYTIANTDLYGFEGFEILASKANASKVIDETGVMTPSADGNLYVIADSTVVLLGGWTALAGTEMSYHDRTLRIFRKSVTAGEKVVIPEATDFRGVTPIAESIDLIEIYPEEDTRLNDIIIEEVSLVGFNKDIKDYKYYLPYTATTTPSISVVKHEEGSNVVIRDAHNILGSTIEDRTSVVEVTSQNGQKVATYNLEFVVLPELDLFLCIGQSNMAGAAKLEPEKGDLDIIDNAFLFNSYNKFEAARNGMNRYANVLTSKNEYYGLTHSFSQKIISKINKPIGLVVNARGGSAIQLWEKTGTDAGDTLYVKTMERAIEAQKWGTYKAVLWAQGEANRANFESIGYMNLLNDLASNLRTDLGISDLFFVAGEIGYWRSDNAPFNAMLRTIESNIDNATYVTADGLINITNLADDDSHFNRESLITLGHRYADAVYNQLYKGSVVGLNDEYSDETGISILSKGKDIYVKCDGKSSVLVTDLTGSMVYRGSIEDETILNLPVAGVYVVVVDNAITTKRVKLLLK